MVEGSSGRSTSATMPSVSVSRPIVGLPGRLECGGVGTVAAGDHGGGVGGGETEASGRRSADQATEHRLPVEAGDAQPVDGAVGADERRGAGVAEQPIVLDRNVAAR